MLLGCSFILDYYLLCSYNRVWYLNKLIENLNVITHKHIAAATSNQARHVHRYSGVLYTLFIH